MQKHIQELPRPATRATYEVTCRYCHETYPEPSSRVYTPLRELEHLLPNGEYCPAQKDGTNARKAELAQEVWKDLNQPLTKDEVKDRIQRWRLPAKTRPGLKALKENDENRVQLAKLREYYQGWVDHTHPESGRGLYLWGKKPGNGKTAAACALAFDLLQFGGTHHRPEWYGSHVLRLFPTVSVECWMVYDLFETQKKSFDGKADFDSEPLKKCDLLILDDMGKNPPTPHTLFALFSWLDMRDKYLRPTIMTANFSLDELAQRYLAVLGDDYERDIAAMQDRIAGSCTQIEFTGPSWRLG